VETESLKEVVAWAESYKKLWEGNLDNLEAYLDIVQKGQGKSDV
jgi:hypothetical protein